MKKHGYYLNLVSAKSDLMRSIAYKHIKIINLTKHDLNIS